MLRSELARELGIDPSVMTKRCKEYFRALDIEDDGQILAEKTIEDVRAASQMIDDGAARTWPEAVRRILGQYTDPVPARSVTDIVQRLDQLETKVDRVADQVTWIATYLRERAEQQGRARGAAQVTPGASPEQQREA